MQTNTHTSHNPTATIKDLAAHKQQQQAARRAAIEQYPLLEKVNRSHVPTEQAAHYVSRQPQTLRHWACRDGTGPLRPIRVHGRLSWSVAEIKKLLGVAQ
jgi:hypothetical protein